MTLKTLKTLKSLLHFLPSRILLQAMIAHVIPIEREIILLCAEIPDHGVATVDCRIGNLLAAVFIIYDLHSEKRICRTGHLLFGNVVSEQVPIVVFSKASSTRRSFIMSSQVTDSSSGICTRRRILSLSQSIASATFL